MALYSAKDAHATCKRAYAERILCFYVTRGVWRSTSQRRMKNPDEASDGGNAMACSVVQSLLDRHQVPKHKQTTLVGKILGVGYHAALRRAQGAVPYTLEELNELGLSFGESLLEVIGGANEFALLQLPHTRIPCRVVLRGPARLDAAGPRLVAVIENGVYVLVDSTSAGNRPALSVRQILLAPEPQPLNRIAVLDDDPKITKAICLDLGDEGFEPYPYHQITDLLDKFKQMQFVAYILDWSVGASTAEQLINEIRGFDPLSPIVVLTGKVEDASIDAEKLSTILSGERMFFYTKPLATKILIAQLKKAIIQ